AGRGGAGLPGGARRLLPHADRGPGRARGRPADALRPGRLARRQRLLARPPRRSRRRGRRPRPRGRRGTAPERRPRLLRRPRPDRLSNVMRLLLTRPRTDGERSAALLARLGHEVELEPLLTIGYRPKPLDLEGVQALLVTSLNGLRAFLASSERRDLPVLAVGPASAEAARAAGFPSVRSAEGDAAALAELVIE